MTIQINNQKSILAKLLATENVQVEHANIPTAAFDLKNRKILLPQWKDISPDLYDLLVGHEVGHGLETPEEGWHDSVSTDPKLKGFLNIVEDARIERKVKERYPGLVKSFYGGYRELFARDFFGVKDLDVNELPLIDRINLHFKVGSLLGINFTDEEQVFVDRVAKTETWADVEQLAQELYGNSQKEAEEMKEQQQYVPQDSDEDFEDDDEMDTPPPPPSSDDEQEDDEEEESEETNQSGNTPSDSDEEDDEEESEEGESTAQDLLDEFMESDGEMSITDQAFRKNEKKLVSLDSLTPVYIDIPQVKDWKKYVVPASVMYTGLNKCFKIMPDYYADAPKDTELVATELLSTFKAKNNSVVNHMVQQFEMKRKATQMSKAKISKTGKLNEDKLWAYKITEDLFKQTTVVPNGKNHGMCMFVDMSGSMSGNMAGTIEQLLTQVLFCKKVNIPFEVYGFTTSSEYGAVETQRIPGQFALQKEDMMLRHLFSGSWNKTQTESAMKHLLCYAEYFTQRSSNNRYENEWWAIENRNYQLGGTNLNHTLIMAMQIVKDFRKANNVEIMNTLFLTDGGATDSVEIWEQSPHDDERIWSKGLRHDEKTVFRHKQLIVGGDKNIRGRDRNYNTLLLVEMFKLTTGSSAINYYLMEGGSTRNVTYEFESTQQYNSGFSWCSFEDGQYMKTFRRDGVLMIQDQVGYDARFLVNGKKLGIAEDVLEVNSSKKGDLLRGFKKFNSGKVQKRVFLSKFMDMVA